MTRLNIRILSAYQNILAELIINIQFVKKKNIMELTEVLANFLVLMQEELMNTFCDH